MTIKRSFAATILALVCVASPTHKAAAQSFTDSLTVTVVHDAADAGLIRISFDDHVVHPDSAQVMSDSLQYGEISPALVYFNSSQSALYFYLHDYDSATHVVYGVSSADVIAAGNYFELIIRESLPEWLDAVFEGGTTLRVEYVLVEGVEPDEPQVIDGDISVYPNPSVHETRVEFDATHPVSLAVEVVDVLGRVVTRDGLRTTVGANEYSVDLHGLGAGVYFIRLSKTDGRGSAARSAKFIVVK